MRPSQLSTFLSIAGALLIGFAGVAAIAALNPPGGPTVYRATAILVLLGAAAYLVWNVRPSYVFCAALLLAPVSGNWQQLGIPGFAAPDRLLLIAAIASVLVRAPGAQGRPRIRIEAVHWLMLATVGYALVSAVIAHSLFDKTSFFKLLEVFGVLPFLTFVAAPLAFRTERDREILLRTFVVFGAYLGLTTLFERLHLDPLVFPKYILDPNYGIHTGRGRGAFVEAVSNGYAQYVCAVVCAIAWSRWRGRRPGLAAVVLAIAALDMVGAFLSLERSVWVGAIMGTVVALTAVREARRYAAAAIAGVAVVVGASLLLIPGFSGEVQKRSSDNSTIWDRKNLTRAAVNMVEARPLLGFGWDQFPAREREYFVQSLDYPLTKNIGVTRLHSILLTYAVDVGLVGLLLWLATLAAGVGGALASRGPPDVRAWRIALLAVAVSYLIVTNFVPPSVFPNLSVWLLAGVVWSGRYAGEDDAGMPAYRAERRAA